MIKVVVCGAHGRMGSTIGRLVNEAADMELVGGVDLKPGSFFGAPVVETGEMASLLSRTKPGGSDRLHGPGGSGGQRETRCQKRHGACRRHDGFLS